jgi:hypothetical protein
MELASVARASLGLIALWSRVPMSARYTYDTCAFVFMLASISMFL